ncbi:MAG TPA: preprotein translocase subunit SecE [Candidatus Bathyarchaeia archaeon]|nr:preprotein translocase subunit SecE [Candidatus Bathyarchaeia archaeon]
MAKLNLKRAKPFVFLKEVKAELDKVIWPTRRQIIRLTGIVVGVSTLVAIFIAILDFIFTKLMEILIKS